MKMIKGKAKKKSKGFTLIELIISVAIVSAVLIPIAAAFANTARHNGKAKRQHDATLAAQNVMEKYKYMSLQDIKVLHNIVTTNPDDATAVIDLKDSSDKDSIIDTYVLWAMDFDTSGSARRDGSGAYYVRGASNEKYYCKVTISPEAYISSDSDSKTLVNSYESPKLGNLYNGNNLVVSNYLSANDAAAALFLGFNLNTERSVVTKYVTIEAQTKSNGAPAAGAEEMYTTSFYLKTQYEYKGAYSPEYSKFLWSKEYCPAIGETIPNVYIVYDVFDYTNASTANDRILIKHKFLDSDGSKHDQYLKAYIIEAARDDATSHLAGDKIFMQTVFMSGSMEVGMMSRVSCYSDVPGFANPSYANYNKFLEGEASNSLYEIKVEVYDDKNNLLTTLVSTREADYGYKPIE